MYRFGFIFGTAIHKSAGVACGGGERAAPLDMSRSGAASLVDAALGRITSPSSRAESEATAAAASTHSGPIWGSFEVCHSRRRGSTPPSCML